MRYIAIITSKKFIHLEHKKGFLLIYNLIILKMALYFFSGGVNFTANFRIFSKNVKLIKVVGGRVEEVRVLENYIFSKSPQYTKVHRKKIMLEICPCSGHGRHELDAFSISFIGISLPILLLERWLTTVFPLIWGRFII